MDQKIPPAKLNVSPEVWLKARSKTFGRPQGSTSCSACPSSLLLQARASLEQAASLAAEREVLTLEAFALEALLLLPRRDEPGHADETASPR